MPKILLITVGGSFQPDRVIFIASSGEKGSQSQVIGEGTPCEIRRGAETIAKLPNIPTQVELGDRFNPERDLILIHNPDDLGECYRLPYQCIRNLQKDPDQEILADYTGGTKTLSAGLVLAAVDCKISLYLTKLSAPRKPLDSSMGVRRWRIYSPWFHHEKPR